MLIKHLHVIFSRKIAFDCKFMVSSSDSQFVALQSQQSDRIQEPPENQGIQGLSIIQENLSVRLTKLDFLQKFALFS